MMIVRYHNMFPTFKTSLPADSLFEIAIEAETDVYSLRIS
jgi:hypothetical protein